MLKLSALALLFAATAAFAEEEMHIPKPEPTEEESAAEDETREIREQQSPNAPAYLSTVPAWEAGGGYFAFPQDAQQTAEPSEAESEPSPEPASAYRKARASADRFARRMHTWSPSWPARETEAPSPYAENMQAVFEGMLQAAEGPARLRALETIDGEATLENLNRIMAALVDRDPDVRAKARELLETQDPEEIADRFIEGALQQRPELNQAITETAPGMRERLEAPVLQRFTREDASTQERLAAAWLLTLMRSADATESLAATAWDTSHPPLAVQCAQAIVAGEAPEAQRHLMEMARHPFSDVRRIAIRALAQYGGADALAVVQQVATGPHERDTTVREEAILLLGQWGDPSAVPALLQVLQQRPHLRRVTVAALQQLTGQDFGMDASRWVQWWRQVLQERGISPQQQQAMAPQQQSQQAQPGQPDPRGNIPQQQFLEQQRRRQQMQQQRAQEQPGTPEPDAESDESAAEQQPPQPSIGQGGQFIAPGQPGGGMRSRSENEIGGPVQPGQPGGPQPDEPGSERGMPGGGDAPQQPSPEGQPRQPSMPQQPGLAPPAPRQQGQPGGVRQPNMPENPEQDQPIEWSRPPQDAPPQQEQQQQPMPQQQRPPAEDSGNGEEDTPAQLPGGQFQPSPEPEE
ncbi:MAG: HEAT repeat domain-containing protein [Candidatus Hydrogenedentota bacterium]